MEEYTQRTELLLGTDALKKLNQCHVAVFGLGGVGGYAAEALARTGIGELTLVDADAFHPSNLNRQLFATTETLGKRKTEVAAARLKTVAPNCKIHPLDFFYTPENAHQIDLSQFDYIVDAIDTVTSKIHLICAADAAKIPLISSMGTGNKLDPTRLKITDLYKTEGCPLARVLRRELKARGIRKLKVVFSDEEPKKTVVPDESSPRHAPASAIFVPACAGLTLAAETVKDLTKQAK